MSLIARCADSLEQLSGRVENWTRRSQTAFSGQVKNSLDTDLKGKSRFSLSTGDINGQLSSLVVAKSLVNLIFSLAMEQAKSKAKAQVCHQCHAPRSDPSHVGFPCGVGVCELDHWDGCMGGIPGGNDAKGKTWASCPDPDNSLDETLSNSDDGEQNDESLTEIAPASGKASLRQQLPSSVKEAAADLERMLPPGMRSRTIGSTSEDSDSSSDDDDLVRQRAELAQLQLEVEQQAKSAKTAAKAAKKEEKLRRKAQEKADLASKLEDLKKKKALLNTPMNNQDTSLKDKVSEHEAKKARKAAAKLVKAQNNDGLTIGGIRSLPDVRQEVETYISRLKSMVPSLASDPTAAHFGSATFQPEGVYAGDSETKNDEYIYVADLGRVIPVVKSLKDVPKTTLSSSRPVPEIVDSSESESECSADEDCELEPAAGMKFSWKRHDDGRKYFKQVAVKKQPRKMRVTYQLDSHTGNYEKFLVPEQSHDLKKSKVKVTPSTTQYRDHRVPAMKGIKAQTRKEERQPSFVSSDPEKKGKESRVPSLVEFARDCPVSWTSKVTTPGINSVLYSWAYIAELLATRTGQAPALEEGELEARLQHFLSVMEVTLQTSQQTDFSSESWKIARLYHQKVQDKVDSGSYSWLGLSRQWGTATLPHELMAANAELSTKPRRKMNDSPRRGGRADRDKEKDKDASLVVPLCSSWNNSETKGKCKWEAEGEGRKCNRQHYCSWCRRDSNQTNFHQKTFCKKRQERDGGE